MRPQMDRDLLRRRMGEAAVLPADDPDRRAIETDIAQAGAWAETEWLDLLRETEALRLALRRGKPPVDLHARLLRIPDEVEWRRPNVSVGTLSPLSIAGFFGGLIAASLVIATLLFVPGPTKAVADPVENVAFLAAQNHEHHSFVTVETNDRYELAKRLGEQVSFAVQVPDLSDHYELRGGRRCALGSTAVTCIRWRRTTPGSCRSTARGTDRDPISSSAAAATIDDAAPATDTPSNSGCSSCRPAPPPAADSMTGCNSTSTPPSTTAEQLDGCDSCAGATNHAMDCICSLYQFARHEFDMPPFMPATTISIRTAGRETSVLVWSDDRFGYALISDCADDLDTISARVCRKKKNR